jgi:hypothetical protein
LADALGLSLAELGPRVEAGDQSLTDLLCVRCMRPAARSDSSPCANAKG